MPQPIPVALARRPDYASAPLERAVAELFTAIGFAPSPGTHVLIKPNLLSAANHGRACTHPQVVRAACVYLLDFGARVRVGDSPGFGSGKTVARRTGLAATLADLGVPVIDLGRPTPVRLPFGHALGVSRDALEAELILNLPKLKAHGQMRVTGAVKNFFGCVAGARKAMAHTRHGDQGRRFESMLVELMQALPPAVSLLDAIVPMHVTGPVDGAPVELGLLAASANAVALDTAVYAMLGLKPEAVPLWREARRRTLPGSDPDEIGYPLEQPEAFDTQRFEVPAVLKPVTFHPVRLARSLVRRGWARLRK